MTKAKYVTGVVNHPKVYKMVDGKLQHVPKGTEISEMTEEQIDRSRGKIIAKKDAKKLVVGAAEADLKVAQAALDAVKPPTKADKAKADKAKADKAKADKAAAAAQAALDAVKK